MSTPVASRMGRIIENIAVAFAVTVIVVAIWVLARYALHAWPSATAHGAPANPAGAVLAMLVAFAVLVRISLSRGHGGTAVGRALAAIVFGLASLKVVGVILGVDVVFDHVLFANQLEGPPANRMALNAAIAFMFLGSSLLLQFSDRFPKTADLLSLGGFLIIFQGAVGFLFGERTLASFGWERAISLHSLLAMVLLALSVILARPKEGLTAIFADEGAAGAAARRLIPAAFVTPFIVGVLFSSHADPLRLAYVTLASAVAFCVILAASIGKLLRIDRQRLDALRDISEQSAKDRALMESIGDGVFAVDQEWRITFWNKGAERITGFTAGDAVGKLLREVMVIRDAKTRKENMEVIDRALRLGESASLGGDNVIVAKDGHEVPIGDSAAPVSGADGGTSAGAIVVFRDVTNEKRVAKLRQDFLFRTIHDLRAPAGNVNLLIQNFDESGAEFKSLPHVVRGMRTINELNDQMRRLIEDLLDVAKSTDPAFRLRTEPVDVAPMVEGIFARHAAAANERRMRLEQVPPAVPAVVLADGDALTEVLENLVGNAVKYGKDGGIIRVSSEVANGSCAITVWDDGAGIAPEDIPPIFDPYFRVPGTGKPGTGLGLYIVRQLIEKMGGRVECSSELGKWTAFKCVLPTPAASASAQENAA